MPIGPALPVVPSRRTVSPARSVAGSTASSNVTVTSVAVRTTSRTCGGVQSVVRETVASGEVFPAASRATTERLWWVSARSGTATRKRPSAATTACATAAPPVTTTVVPGSALPVTSREEAQTRGGSGSRTGGPGAVWSTVVNRTVAGASGFPARSASADVSVRSWRSESPSGEAGTTVTTGPSAPTATGIAAAPPALRTIAAGATVAGSSSSLNVRRISGERDTPD